MAVAAAGSRLADTEPDCRAAPAANGPGPLRRRVAGISTRIRVMIPAAALPDSVARPGSRPATESRTDSETGGRDRRHRLSLTVTRNPSLTTVRRISLAARARLGPARPGPARPGGSSSGSLSHRDRLARRRAASAGLTVRLAEAAGQH